MLEKHPIRPVGGAEGAPIELRSYEAISSRPLVHQVSDWCSGAAANFDWMREAKRENTRCGL